MPHITPQALEVLFRREQDMSLCLHGVRSRIIPTSAGPRAVVRIVGHLVLDEVPAEDDGQVVPEEFYLVLDLPMAPETVALVNGHFDDTMGQMVDSALEAIITEDGET